MLTVTWSTLLLTCLLLTVLHQTQSQPMGVECFPGRMKNSCLRGCLSCWDAFGGELYDMAACCRECRRTQAYIIDQGPSRCSMEHVQKSWLKRFG